MMGWPEGLRSIVGHNVVDHYRFMEPGSDWLVEPRRALASQSIFICELRKSGF